MPKNISPSQLQAIIDLPPSEAVKHAKSTRCPSSLRMNAKWQCQIGICEVAANQGQQPYNYNICMGKAEEQTDSDYAGFYNNLQLLCHDQDQLVTLQSSEQAWQTYRDAMEARHASSRSDGTRAPGLASRVHLLLVRNRMRELYTMYDLNLPNSNSLVSRPRDTAYQGWLVVATSGLSAIVRLERRETLHRGVAAVNE
jgi:uncharacterized protein YecT (DUF1311 family)